MIVDYIFVIVDLSQKEINHRVKLICENAPTTTVGAPRILAVVTEEKVKEHLKVIKS